MLEIDVPSPTRMPTRYEFEYTVSPRSWFRRHGSVSPTRHRFGFEASNFVIPHHPLWDGFYALLYLTRNGGPIFRSGQDARIRLHFPVSPLVRRFFVRRARHMGYRLSVRAPDLHARFDSGPGRPVLAFGGGKDSRLLLGVLREVGREPLVVTAGGQGSADIVDALHTTSIPRPEGTLADRVMPGLMMLPETWYVGAGLGEVHRVVPWHQYYDLASPHALAELSGLFAALGADVSMTAPAAVLPHNVIQRILVERYPELAAHQVSVRAQARTRKNLSISSMLRLCGQSIDEQCSPELFGELAREFLADQLGPDPDFGYRHRALTNTLELRAILARLRSDPLLDSIAAEVPDEWDANWIDAIHPYVAASPDDVFLPIFRRHAPTVDELAVTAAVRRIAT